MIQIMAVVAAVLVLMALSVLQILVAAGLPYGALVWGGQHRVLPRLHRMGSACSVLLYALFAAILLSRAGILSGGHTAMVGIGIWSLFGYFTLGIVVNGISRSRPERLVMTPTCAILAAASLALALS